MSPSFPGRKKQGRNHCGAGEGCCDVRARSTPHRLCLPQNDTLAHSRCIPIISGCWAWRQSEGWCGDRICGAKRLPLHTPTSFPSHAPLSLPKHPAINPLLHHARPGRPLGVSSPMPGRSVYGIQRGPLNHRCRPHLKICFGSKRTEV